MVDAGEHFGAPAVVAKLEDDSEEDIASPAEKRRRMKMQSADPATEDICLRA
jgi:hypothetical protein